MAKSRSGSTFWKRRLGAELRRVREQTARITAEEAGEKLEWNRQKIWRIEKGQQDLRVLDVQIMCQIYGADDDTTAALKGLATAAQNGDWWQSYGDAIPRWFNVYLGLEEVATELRWYEAEIVPGLMQTDRYARAVFNTAGGAADEDDLERKAAARLRRQAALTRDKPAPPMVDIVINEAALWRPIGGTEVMAEQLDALLEFKELPHVTVRVFPFAAGAHGGMNAGEWGILRFPPDTEPETVFYEGLTGAAYLYKPHEVAQYNTVFDDLAERSLDSRESAEMIAQAMRRYQE